MQQFTNSSKTVLFYSNWCQIVNFVFVNLECVCYQIIMQEVKDKYVFQKLLHKKCLERIHYLPTSHNNKIIF